MDDKMIIPAALFAQMVIALRTTNEVLQKHRLAGLDQNPKGISDLVGSTLLAAERFGKGS